MMERIAEAYVKLVLRIGEYDPDYIDFYIGPKEWKPVKEKTPDEFPYQELKDQVGVLLQHMAEIDFDDLAIESKSRFSFLKKQIRAVITKIELMNGRKYDFDTKSKLLYDVVSPQVPESYFKSVLKEIDLILPGTGDITERYLAFQKSILFPAEKAELIFKTTIEESRRRTEKFIPVPENETISIELVSNKPWGAYCWYEGNYHSNIQINLDRPREITLVAFLVCHEGYPGHHLFNLILEEKIYREKGWLEFCIYPLESPQSLISEGSANYGLELAFPGNDKIKYDEEILFPLADLDPSQAKLSNRIQTLKEKLGFARNETARRYLDGNLSKSKAKEWLIKYQLLSDSEADRTIGFIENYHCYLINYTVGQLMVENYVRKKQNDGNQVENRWKIFEEILSTPYSPSDLV